MENTGTVLILEPNEQIAAEIVKALERGVPDARPHVTRTLEGAQHLALTTKPDLFVLDVDGTHGLGQDFLYDLRTSHPHARAIMLTSAQFAVREQTKGLGAIHFLEKPFPPEDFELLAQTLLVPASDSEGEKFQGTLSDLHIADIVQLKCMGGATSVLEFTGPQGEKARIYFENGQVRHATAPGKNGVAAFNEIVNWKGGMISEVAGANPSPKTIDSDWQLLLMEAVRSIDESSEKKSEPSPASAATEPRKVLVIDDSLMLLSFVCEILTEAHYEVANAATAEDGLAAAGDQPPPDLVLLDYVLPDMKGNEVTRRLRDNPLTTKIPVLYMSGLGTDLQPDQLEDSNVIGFLNKPFTSDTLLRTIEKYMPKKASRSETAPAPEPQAPAPAFEEPSAEQPQAFGAVENAEPFLNEEILEEAAPVWSESESTAATEEFYPAAEEPFVAPEELVEDSFAPVAYSPPAQEQEPIVPMAPPPDGGAFFSGDTSFFSLHWALQTVSREKLTGTLRCFWDRATIELLARNGRIVLATTREAELYCSEAPITLVNVDADRIAQARARQAENGCPLFLALADEGLILRDPAIQLVHHYGQKLFAQLWTAGRVRFVFEQSDQLPECARDLPAEQDVDQWSLSTLRFVQYQELGDSASYDAGCVPAYTRDGFERIQNLRLTVAEAQFASQFNGVRSVQQIAKNLRLDIKFARLTLFRFVALEIVECWPAETAPKPEKRGLFKRIGFGS